MLLDEATALDWSNDYARAEECVIEAMEAAAPRAAGLALAAGAAAVGDGPGPGAPGPVGAGPGMLLDVGGEPGPRPGRCGLRDARGGLLLLARHPPQPGPHRRSRARAGGEHRHRAPGAGTGSTWAAPSTTAATSGWRSRICGERLEDQEQFKQLGRELGMAGWEYFAETTWGSCTSRRETRRRRRPTWPGRWSWSSGTRRWRRGPGGGCYTRGCWRTKERKSRRARRWTPFFR